MKALFPITITDKINETKDFYIKHFNFTPVFEESWYVHLRHENGIEMAIMIPGLDNQPDFLRDEFNGKGIVYSFEVDNAQSEYERVKLEGLEIVMDLKEEVWGQIHFILKDPAGVYIDVVEHLGN